MHITEGIITGAASVAYTAGGLGCVAWGAAGMNKFVRAHPDKKPLLGMGGALIFFFSLIPIPAFTGTCSHPCGTPLIAILLGPAIGTALTGGTLLLQAALFAHGGFATWGANVIALGLGGCLFGWGAFSLARKAGAPLWAAGFAGGLMGNLAVYGTSGLILGATLAHAPSPQYSFSGYLSVIYLAYLPTQLPIAVGEMLVTGLALRHVAKQRPEVLVDLGVIHRTEREDRKNGPVLVLALAAALTAHPALTAPAGAENGPGASADGVGAERTDATAGSTTASMMGMDEAVNERLAETAGITPRSPGVDTESMGDLWNALLLGAGGICGFIIGRWWHLLTDRPRRE